MNAFKIFIDNHEMHKMLDLVSKLNSDEEIMAVIVNPDEFVVATTGECSLAYAKAVIESNLSGYSIEVIK